MFLLILNRHNKLNRLHYLIDIKTKIANVVFFFGWLVRLEYPDVSSCDWIAIFDWAVFCYLEKARDLRPGTLFVGIFCGTSPENRTTMVPLHQVVENPNHRKVTRAYQSSWSESTSSLVKKGFTEPLIDVAHGIPITH